MSDRTAHVIWTGSLMDGSGTITQVGSGAFGPLDITWGSRAEDSDGRTSPEELIAAAHAACFSMALSHGLAQAGTPPEKLDVDATVTFVPGTGITKIALGVVARRTRDRRGRIRRRRPRLRRRTARSRRRSPSVPRSR